ncbi:MAG: 4Fe-4S dicluster domain-containing protein, partial [Thermodesulfovibrionales bacterium]|nr:4Fe-4S dicluster domain-containing protein [Thermodesulfovibrionales bacterium]
MNIAIIFCQCGGLLSLAQNDLDKLLPKTRDNIFFETIGLACSEDNKQYLIDKIKQNHIEGIIFVGCSPNFKGAYFYELTKESGVNPNMISFVNIREQVLWVTEDKSALVRKIKALLNGSFERLKRQKPVQEKKFLFSNDVLIVGAGVSGLQSALTLANTGYNVYLVEQTNYLGGRSVTYEKLFPNLECGPCKIHPLIDEVMNCPSINLITNSEVIDVKGSRGNYFVKILRRKNIVDVKKCIGCFQCVEVCPEKCISIDIRRQPLIADIDYDKCLVSKGTDCSQCIQACPVEETIDFGSTDKIEEIQIGSIIWATGFSLFDCSKIESLGYGRYDNVYNSEDFEDILNSNGTTRGKIITKSGEKPQNIAIIHCVGSLDDDYLPYCSKICCQVAFKFNRQIREALPDAHIHHFVKEIVVPGKDAYKLYNLSKNDKFTEIFRYNSISDLVIKQDERLSFFCNINTFMYDIIVLIPAIVCIEGINLDIKGILYVGSVKEPMTIEESITDAMSVSALLISSKKGGEFIVKDFPIACIDIDKCSKCSTCITQCPCKAIDINENRI